MGNQGQPQLDRERLEQIVANACDRLDGDWLLIGGALVAAGLADGAAQPVSEGRFDEEAIALALGALPAPAALDDTSRELLLAWLCALRDHFRPRFDSLLGSTGAALIDGLQGTPIDPNRFLKFRRISLARLALLI